MLVDAAPDEVSRDASPLGCAVSCRALVVPIVSCDWQVRSPGASVAASAEQLAVGVDDDDTHTSKSPTKSSFGDVVDGCVSCRMCAEARAASARAAAAMAPRLHGVAPGEPFCNRESWRFRFVARVCTAVWASQQAQYARACFRWDSQ